MKLGWNPKTDGKNKYHIGGFNMSIKEFKEMGFSFKDAVKFVKAGVTPEQVKAELEKKVQGAYKWSDAEQDVLDEIKDKGEELQDKIDEIQNEIVELIQKLKNKTVVKKFMKLANENKFVDISWGVEEILDEIEEKKALKQLK